MLTGLKRQNARLVACDTSLFRKVFLITLSFEMIAFLDVAALAIKCAVLLWGLFILVHNFFLEKRAFEVKYAFILWIFLALMLVTCVVHMSVFFVPNLVLILYSAACFFIFYGMYTGSSYQEIQKEMVFLLKFFVYFGTICAALSLFVLFWGRQITIGPYNLGIYKNRLIGIYTNSNILAFSMIESIVACDILSDSYIKNKFTSRILKPWILLLCFGFCCVCLFLSDSNASFLFLIIYFTIRVFCNIFFKNIGSYATGFFRSILIVTGLCLVMMSGSLALRGKCQSFISNAMSDISRRETTPESTVKSSNSVEKSENSDELVLTVKDESEDTPQIYIGRRHYEVSSGRITLLKQGVEVFKHNPILGIGRANLGLYSKKYLGQELIYPDLHNGYLTILVSCGISGFLVFAVFSFVVALDICKYMFFCCKRAHFGVFAKLFSALVAYCGYCLFEKAILFDMTFMVGFFWVMLGYAVSFIYHREENKF